MKNNSGNGGDAGEIFIAAKRVVGGKESKIEANGGDGLVGGKGGKITLITDDNNFAGEISAHGGKSVVKNKQKEVWYKNWWMKFVLYPLAVLIVGTIITNNFLHN